MSDNAVTADITIDVPVEEVWDAALDPHRLHEWVTIHRKLDQADDGPIREGMHMKSSLCLRGATFKVSWELTQLEPHRCAVWEGRGPVRSTARTEYHFTPNGDGSTHFHYVNEFKAPMGPLGKVASRALVGGLPKREADKSLAQLKELLEKQ